MGIYVLLYVLACIFFIPGSLLTLGAGAIYGVAQGTILVSISSVLGASCAFLAGRYFARGLVERKIQGNQKFKTIDEAVAKEGWKIVGLTRLSPVFPFNLLNYAYGLTKVSFKDYFFASWIGMFPGTLLYVYVGSLAGDLATISAGKTLGTDNPALRWTVRIVGLLATLLVTILTAKIAKSALSNKVHE